MRKCHRQEPSSGEETSLPCVKICLSSCCSESPLCSYYCPCNLFPPMLPFYIETRSKLIPNPSFPYTCNTSFPQDVVYQGFPTKIGQLDPAKGLQSTVHPAWYQCPGLLKSNNCSFCLLRRKKFYSFLSPEYFLL